MNTPALTMSHLFTATWLSAAFAVWGVLGRATGAPGSWITSMMVIGTVFGGLLFSTKPSLATSAPSALVLLLLFGLGTLNGAAMHFYSVRIADTAVPTAIFIMVVLIGMLMWAPVFDFIFNQVKLTGRQLLRLGLAAFTIWVLVGK